jgi:hypothetical protein
VVFLAVELGGGGRVGAIARPVLGGPGLDRRGLDAAGRRALGRDDLEEQHAAGLVDVGDDVVLDGIAPEDVAGHGPVVVPGGPAVTRDGGDTGVARPPEGPDEDGQRKIGTIGQAVVVGAARGQPPEP